MHFAIFFMSSTQVVWFLLLWIGINLLYLVYLKGLFVNFLHSDTILTVSHISHSTHNTMFFSLPPYTKNVSHGETHFGWLLYR